MGVGLAQWQGHGLYKSKRAMVINFIKVVTGWIIYAKLFLTAYYHSVKHAWMPPQVVTSTYNVGHDGVTSY